MHLLSAAGSGPTGSGVNLYNTGQRPSAFDCNALPDRWRMDGTVWFGPYDFQEPCAIL
ncbi:hypothetical protein DPMN_087783 [Dreissena polymorpha]|uniref:Uncharacterized protein n=1 Tax=Dreissena polymorpha TaxID=45954 RepID=A0A9D4KUM2_DREPO|nr:hypothetical protein DPMN_087783 [Dreissena polymorpha]